LTFTEGLGLDAFLPAKSKLKNQLMLSIEPQYPVALISVSYYIILFVHVVRI